jgi:hypothetical protein
MRGNRFRRREQVEVGEHQHEPGGAPIQAVVTERDVAEAVIEGIQVLAVVAGKVQGLRNVSVQICGRLPGPGRHRDDLVAVDGKPLHRCLRASGNGNGN